MTLTPSWRARLEADTVPLPELPVLGWRQKLWRGVELLALFGGVPMLIDFRRTGSVVVPALMVLGLVLVVGLWRVRTFPSP